MPVWKVLIICMLACVCFVLAMATIAIPIAQDGAQKWVWLGSLLTATAGAGVVFAFFLRYAGGSLDTKPRGGHS
jgi:hypothetical protein